MRIVVGADHAGYELKLQLIQALRSLGHEPNDLGTFSTDRCDYPPICAAVARDVVSGHSELGARAALCNDLYTARMARAHNNANVLAIGARIVAPALAIEILEVFLSTPFEGGRHVARLAQLSDIEKEECQQ